MPRIIVPVSGGKDSQACLRLAVERYGKANVEGMFCETKNEHPLTYAHIEKMKSMYGVEINTVIDDKYPGRDVFERIRSRGQFPSDHARFCTQQLKVQVSARFYNKLLTTDKYRDGYQVWYGMRGTDESTNRTNKYAKFIAGAELIKPNDMNSSYPQKLHKANVWFVLPVVDWTTQDVFDFLGDDVNPLYKAGFERVGCFPCFACATPKKLEQAYNFDDFGRSQKRKLIELENELNIKHEPSNTGQACLFCEI